MFPHGMLGAAVLGLVPGCSLLWGTASPLSDGNIHFGLFTTRHTLWGHRPYRCTPLQTGNGVIDFRLFTGSGWCWILNYWCFSDGLNAITGWRGTKHILERPLVPVCVARERVGAPVHGLFQRSCQYHCR